VSLDASPPTAPLDEPLPLLLEDPLLLLLLDDPLLPLLLPVEDPLDDPLLPLEPPPSPPPSWLLVAELSSPQAAKADAPAQATKASAKAGHRNDENRRMPIFALRLRSMAMALLSPATRLFLVAESDCSRGPRLSCRSGRSRVATLLVGSLNRPMRGRARGELGCHLERSVISVATHHERTAAKGIVMNRSVERHEFQAEVSQLLDLMVHSLYSDKDIFLRELISNASDALDKLRFEQLTKTDLGMSGELYIRIEPDRDKRTLSIIDNGIGMTRDDVIKNIGTIAKSGTKEFLTAVKDAQRKEVPPELIGQFGVGFYSAFMVAQKVALLTRRAGESKATLWESAGDGTYSISESEREQPGTTVTLHLKPEDVEQGLPDFTSDHVIRAIVKRYSDFVAYPIRMKTWRAKAGKSSEAKVFEDETLNSMKAMWDRPRGEVTESEYNEFYRHISHDWNEPLRSIPIKMEGIIEAYALLYVPSKAPFDLYSPEMKRGVQLYVKRIFVMDECKDLMPSYLRFIKGVVDAHDLSLNVSREILQKDRQIQVIRKQLIKKVLATLEEMKHESMREYLEFWAQFGPVLKEGLLGQDVEEREKILTLLLAGSTADASQLTSLEQYVDRMKQGQDAIYVLTGVSKEAVARSPLLETFAEKGYEVLLFSDPIDELWLERAPRFREKSLQPIGRGEIRLGSDEDRKKATEVLEEKQREYGDLLACIRVYLQDEIKEVRLSSRLTSSPACLVGDEHDMSPRMQKMLEQFGQKPQKVKRALELNPNHVLIAKLRAIFEENKEDPRLKLYAELLLGQAHLADSGELPDPAAFARLLADVMLRAV
jgi:molecular chaperone HtpG